MKIQPSSPTGDFRTTTEKITAHAARTGVPQATERSVPVWPCDQTAALLPHLCCSM
jgi:hypothetical protein